MSKKIKSKMEWVAAEFKICENPCGKLRIQHTTNERRWSWKRFWYHDFLCIRWITDRSYPRGNIIMTFDSFDDARKVMLERIDRRYKVIGPWLEVHK